MTQGVPVSIIPVFGKKGKAVDGWERLYFVNFFTTRKLYGRCPMLKCSQFVHTARRNNWYTPSWKERIHGGLWGLPGMVICFPLFAVIYDTVKKAVRRGLAKQGKIELWEQYKADYPDEPSAGA